MTIKSKQLFILIGDSKTGKTPIQKLLVHKLCGFSYAKLASNVQFNITHPEIKRKYRDISFGNRSFQEKKYKNVDNYFSNHFKPADICFIASHLNLDDITAMIRNGKQRFYNVTGIFFTNSIDLTSERNGNISLLNWDERLVIENNRTNNEHVMNNQLEAIADNIVFFLANRTSVS